MSRSMNPKSPISIPNFPELIFSSKSKKPSSSLFQCLSIGLLEIFISFKLNPSLITPTFTSLSKFITQATDFHESKGFNIDILNNYSKILNLIYEEKSPSKAFSYLKYYSESYDPHCYISLEFGLRFILAYLFQNNQSTFNLIINDKPLINYSECLDLFAKQLKISVILIENSKKTVFCDRNLEKLANLFILKNQEDFELLNPDEYLKIENPNFKFVPEKYPFMTIQKLIPQSNPVINLKNTPIVVKSNKIINKKEGQEKSIQPRLNQILAPEPLRPSEIPKMKGRDSLRGPCIDIEEKLSSLQNSISGTERNSSSKLLNNRLDSSILIESAVNPFESNSILIESAVNPFESNSILKDSAVNPFESNSILKDSPVNPFESNSILKDSPVNPFESNSILDSKDSELSNKEDIFEILGKMDVRIRKLKKTFKFIEKALNISDLTGGLEYFTKVHSLKKKINILQIKSFFEEQLQDNEYKLRRLKKICLKIHRPLEITRLEEKEFWKLIMQYDILPSSKTINKSQFAKAFSTCFAIIMQKAQMTESLINSLNP